MLPSKCARAVRRFAPSSSWAGKRGRSVCCRCRCGALPLRLVWATRSVRRVSISVGELPVYVDALSPTEDSGCFCFPVGC